MNHLVIIVMVTVCLVYQRAPSQYTSVPQQQPPQGETAFFQPNSAPFVPSGAAGMVNDPMATAALQYGSHLAHSGGQLMQQNVSSQSIISCYPVTVIDTYTDQSIRGYTQVQVLLCCRHQLCNA